MNEMTDPRELLADYVTNGSEEAFRELVGRYLNLVYGTAMRLVDGNAQFAEEVTQSVFLDLARQARRLPNDVMLGGWLHRDTCFVAGKLMRSERRRRVRERQAVEMNSLQDHSETNLAEVSPLLDEAINRLGAADRTAILLRFFEKRDLRSVGEAMGASENAAQKRVSRALEELRALLKKRGVALSAAGLASVLTAEAITPPAGLALNISAAALSAAGGANTLTLFQLMSFTKTQIGIAGICLLAGLGGSLFVYHRAEAKLREQDAALRLQASQLAELREASSSELVKNDSGPNNLENLARLRREAALLRAQTNDLASLQQRNRQFTSSQKTPLEQVEESKEKGMLRLNFLKQCILAFRMFANDNEDRLPRTFEEVRLYFSHDVETQTGLSPDQFQIVYHGSQNILTNPSRVILIRERQAWPDYTGTNWLRGYGFADGHSEVHRLREVTAAVEAAKADINLDAWEKERMVSIPGSQ